MWMKSVIKAGEGIGVLIYSSKLEKKGSVVLSLSPH